MNPVIFIRSFGVRFANSVVRFRTAADDDEAADEDEEAGRTFERPKLYF